MEDTYKSCKYGVDTKYFDYCKCSGCKADSDAWIQARRIAAKLKAVDALFHVSTIVPKR